MRLLYNLSLRIFSLITYLASPFNAKARQWKKGRKGVFAKIKKEISPDDKVIWVHCASLGEFEQGRPVIEEMRSTFSDHKIVLTFFSPSGYEIRKDYEGADFICYLPLDTAINARKFIKRVNPRIAFFIKYEFWFNYINELKKNKIPLIFVSVIFRRSQYFFKPWAGWGRKQLQKVTYFFVQNEKSLALLRVAKVYHADIGGDTRFDRVLKLTQETVPLPEIQHFKGNSKLVVGGSTWPADEDALLLLLNSLGSDYKLIIAPHIVSKEHIEQLEKKFAPFEPVLFSKCTDGQDFSSRVMIVDGIGKLAYIFRYADVGYIGGGFGVGIHNTLEAATYGLPVIFGPNYQRFKEAVEMAVLGCAFPIESKEQLTDVFKDIVSDEQRYNQICRTAKKYVSDHAGATQKVIDKAKEYLIAP